MRKRIARSGAVGLVAVATLALLPRCGPSSPPQTLDIRFETPCAPGVFCPVGGHTLVWGDHIAYAPLDVNYAWGASELGSLPNFPLSMPLRARFRADFDSTTFSTVPQLRTFHTVREAQIFLRDPQQVYNLDHSIPRTDVAWGDTNVTPVNGNVSLPDAVVMPYPSSVNAGFMGVDPLSTTEFLEGAGIFVGPDALPDPSGAVRGLRIVNSGECSHEIDIKSLIFDGIAQRVKDGLVGGGCGKHSIATLDFFNMSSYLKHQSGLVGNLAGGFLLRGDLRAQAINTSPLSIDDCQPYFDYDYDFSLTAGPSGGGGIQGVFGVAAKQLVLDYDNNNILCVGGVLPLPPPFNEQIPAIGVQTGILLGQDVPDAIYDAALDAQSALSANMRETASSSELRVEGRARRLS